MTLANQLHADGLRAELGISGESVTVAVTNPTSSVITSRNVAANVNRQPLSLEMRDAGYAQREPITLEILKGAIGSTEMITLSTGDRAPLDLRGEIPTNLSTVTIDDVKRTIIGGIEDGGSFWIINTVRSNNRNTGS